MQDFINKKNGTRLAVLAFGVYAIIDAIRALCSLFSFNKLDNFVGDLSTLVLLALTAGFVFIWLETRDTLDLVAAGSLSISAILGVLSFFDVNLPDGTLLSFILSAVLNAYFVVIALKLREKNQMLALLALIAYAFTIFGNWLFIDILFIGIGLPYWLTATLYYLGLAACNGIGLFGLMQQDAQ